MPAPLHLSNLENSRLERGILAVDRFVFGDLHELCTNANSRRLRLAVSVACIGLGSLISKNTEGAIDAAGVLVATANVPSAISATSAEYISLQRSRQQG